MKQAIKTAYIAQLQWVHPTLYLVGDRRLMLAEMAVDQALAGRLNLQGECWEWALLEVTGRARWTARDLKELPE